MWGPWDWLGPLGRGAGRSWDYPSTAPAGTGQALVPTPLGLAGSGWDWLGLAGTGWVWLGLGWGWAGTGLAQGWRWLGRAGTAGDPPAHPCRDSNSLLEPTLFLMLLDGL